MDIDIKELGEYISSTISVNVDDVAFAKDELTLTVPVASLIKVLSFLRDDVNCQFKQLMDVCGIDYPAQEKRFGVVYNLLSLTLNLRVRVKFGPMKTHQFLQQQEYLVQQTGSNVKSGTCMVCIFQSILIYAVF